MTIALDRPLTEVTTEPFDPVARTPHADVGSVLVIGAVASLAAGAVHVAAIAAHSEHRQAVWAFFGTALVQLVWGAAALARPRRWLAAVGAVTGAMFFGGWVLAKTGGISFVDGLDVREPMRFADGLAAALALVTVLSCATVLVARRLRLPRMLSAIACIALVAVGVPGSLAAVDHQHSHAVEEVVAGGIVETPSAVPPRPFDPSLPIDLGGVPGVTPQEQARAENLLAATLLRLPQWSDPAYAEAQGFRSIGDGVTGVEHYVNLTFIGDTTILDPDQPESLVYDTTVTPKKLVAAMYMLTPGSTIADAPDVGGALTQWHIHNNLCFTLDGHVGGLTQGDGSCAAPLVNGPQTPMIHVWIEAHPCGPFAALEGIGGGQVAAGEAVSCDHVHGT